MKNLAYSVMLNREEIPGSPYMFTSETENEASVGLHLEIEGEMGVYGKRGGVKPCVHVHNHM